MKSYTLKYGDKDIEYTINRAKRKHIYICIVNGKVVIKTPLKASDDRIKEAVLNKAEWIIKKISISNTENKAKEYIDGETFYVLGIPYTLKIVYAKVRSVKIEKDEVSLTALVPASYEKSLENQRIKTAIDNFYKITAKEEIAKSMERICFLTGLYPKKVTIKKLTRSWGRCSSTGNISINQNIAMYSSNIIDSVVLHELCHLTHMNHSKDFWDLVESYMPDYKERSKLLKSNIV